MFFASLSMKKKKISKHINRKKTKNDFVKYLQKNGKKNC